MSQMHSRRRPADEGRRYDDFRPFDAAGCRQAGQPRRDADVPKAVR